MPTNEERRAKLQAELAALETESRNERVNAQVDDLDIGDVLAHLVQHSSGYPTQEDREVHARVVDKHHKRGEFAEDDQAPEDDQGEPQDVRRPVAGTRTPVPGTRFQSDEPGQPVPSDVPEGHVAEAPRG